MKSLGAPTRSFSDVFTQGYINIQKKTSVYFCPPSSFFTLEINVRVRLINRFLRNFVSIFSPLPGLSQKRLVDRSVLLVADEQTCTTFIIKIYKRRTSFDVERRSESEGVLEG